MTKQKLHALSDAHITGSLYTWWMHAAAEDTRDGMKWYSEARHHIKREAMKLAIDFSTLAYVVAATSPRMQWSRNVEVAVAMVKAHRKGLTPEEAQVGQCLTRSAVKAYEVLNGNPLLPSDTAPKTHAFAMNLINGGGSHVTLDVWMLRILTNDPSDTDKNTQEFSSFTINQYRRFERLVCAFAETCDVEPAQLQAVLWTSIRNHFGEH